MRYLLIGILIVLAGCAPRGFVRDGASYRDFYADLRKCEAENTPKWHFCTGYACKHQRSEFNKRRNQCMQAMGWTPSDDEKAYRP